MTGGLYTSCFVYFLCFDWNRCIVYWFWKEKTLFGLVMVQKKYKWFKIKMYMPQRRSFHHFTFQKYISTYKVDTTIPLTTQPINFTDYSNSNSNDITSYDLSAGLSIFTFFTQTPMIHNRQPSAADTNGFTRT